MRISALVLVAALFPLTATASPPEHPTLHAVARAQILRRAAFERAKRAKTARLEEIALRYQTPSFLAARPEAKKPEAPAVQIRRYDPAQGGRTCWPEVVPPAKARACTCECP